MPLTLLSINLAVTLSIMFCLWLISLRRNDVSIVDLYWGPGFAVVAWISLLTTQTDSNLRHWLVVGLVSLWALRLAVYLGWRARNHADEDPRYAAMRAGRGKAFVWQSLYIVFGLQGMLIWLLSFPLQFGLTNGQAFNLISLAGAAIALFGLVFETIADYQLARFKRQNPAAGALLTEGLWGLTRHPNYFGETCFQWGLFLLAAGHWPSVWTVWAPLLMTFLILRISGVRLLEEQLSMRKPDYAEYQRQTPAFIPRLSRRQTNQPIHGSSDNTGE